MAGGLTVVLGCSRLAALLLSLCCGCSSCVSMRGSPASGCVVPFARLTRQMADGSSQLPRQKMGWAWLTTDVKIDERGSWGEKCGVMGAGCGVTLLWCWVTFVCECEWRFSARIVWVCKRARLHGVAQEKIKARRGRRGRFSAGISEAMGRKGASGARTALALLHAGACSELDWRMEKESFHTHDGRAYSS